MANVTAASEIALSIPKLLENGAKYIHFSGEGSNSCELVAAAEDVKHIVVEGRVSVTAADTVYIKSASTTRETIPFVATGAALLPSKIETAVNEALNVQKADNGSVTMDGWIIYVSVYADGTLVNGSGPCTIDFGI